MQNLWMELSQTIATAVAQASQSVVAVSAPRNGWRSGILISPSRVLTMDSGIEEEEDIQVLLPSGQVVAATLLGRDPGWDLSLLELDAPYGPTPALGLADGATLGELITVVSRMPDTGPNASLGIIGTLTGGWRTWTGGKLDHLIRLDLAPHAGLSGGVALRADGTVLGLVSVGLARGAAVVIPSSNLHRFVETITAHGELGRGYLGVGLQPVPQPAGMIVLSVDAGSPSADAQLMVGDVILTIGGQRANDFGAIQEFLEPPHIGQRVPLRVMRAGQELELTIEIGRRPSVRRVA